VFNSGGILRSKYIED